MTMVEMVQKVEKLEQILKQKRQRRDRGSSSSSTNIEDSDMKAFYQPSRERRDSRSHKFKHMKLFKHNVRFPKFSGQFKSKCI